MCRTFGLSLPLILICHIHHLLCIVVISLEMSYFNKIIVFVMQKLCEEYTQIIIIVWDTPCESWSVSAHIPSSNGHRHGWESMSSTIFDVSLMICLLC